MADTLNIGINVVAGPAKKALNDVSKATGDLSESIGRAQKSTRKLGNQFNGTAVATNKFAKGAMQQAGYQIADFAVQVQNGTSAVQAFGQQGSQMLAVFGPAGAILGAVVAVGSALTTVLIGVAGASKDLSSQTQTTAKIFEEFDSSLSSLSSRMDTELSSSTQKLEQTFGSLASQAKEVISELRKLDKARAFSSLVASMGKAGVETKSITLDAERLSKHLQAIDDLSEGAFKTKVIEEFRKTHNKTVKQARELVDINKRLTRVLYDQRKQNTAEDYIAQAAALSDLAKKIPDYSVMLQKAAQSNLDMAKTISGGSVDALKQQRKQLEATQRQLIAMARGEVAASAAAAAQRDKEARARKKEDDERARQAVKLAAGETQAAQAAARAREREAAERKASQAARAREAQAIFEAEQRRVKSIEKAYSDSLASINKETEALRLQNELFGQSEEAIKAQVDFLAITAALKEKGKNFTLEELDAIHAQLKARAEEAGMLEHKKEEQKLQEEREKATNAALKKINAERERAQRRINQLIGDGFRTAGDAIAGLISGTNTWREALTQVLRKVIDIAAQMGTTKSGGFSFDKLFGAVGGLFSGGPSFSPVSQAGPIGPGGVQTFHTGGIVGRNSGPIGPRSDERLIMARTGERVLNRGEAMGSAGGGGVVVNQTINLSTGVQQTVRAEVMSLAPQIAAQAKAAVLDAKKRGGGFGAAFA